MLKAKSRVIKNVVDNFCENATIKAYEFKWDLDKQNITKILTQIETNHIILKEVFESKGELISELADDGIIIFVHSFSSGRYSIDANNILLNNGALVQHLGKFVRVNLI